MRYVCTQGAETINWACSQDPHVICWVSRPYEKQIFLLYMTTMSLISVIVVLSDFFFVIFKVSVKKLRRRREKQKLKNRGTDEQGDYVPPYHEEHSEPKVHFALPTDD